MDRLTFRTKDGISLNKDGNCPPGMNCLDCNRSVINCNYITKVIKKLAEYEDLDDKGLLLRTPYKVGDTVYLIRSNCRANLVPDEECEALDCNYCKYDKEKVVCEIIVDYNLLFHIMFSTDDNFVSGVTVFTMREDAEEKLNEIKEHFKE